MTSPEPQSGIGLEQVREAAGRIAGQAHRTPVVTCAALDRRAGCRLFFKCESLQKGGAFKFRGACNAVAQLPADRAVRGVVTHSSGNFAQALALAARLRGIDAHLVMPRDASAIKRRAVEGYGGRVVLCEPTLAARETTAEMVLAETGGTFIHPYDDPAIIAGQGTVALELLEQVPDLDAMIAPVGGGGLIAGICIAAHALAPRLRVLGAEPAGADDAARSLAAGRLIPQADPRTVADGLLTSLGQLTWPIIREHVAHVVTVEDPETIEAMRRVWTRAKLVIEPSAAVAVAAAMRPGVAERCGAQGAAGVAGGARVGVVLSGGNVDLDHLPW